MKADLKIKHIVVMAEMSDGKIYNVLLKKETQEVVISTISLCENGIQLLDKPVEGVEITTPFKKNKNAKSI